MNIGLLLLLLIGLPIIGVVITLIIYLCVYSSRANKRINTIDEGKAVSENTKEAAFERRNTERNHSYPAPYIVLKIIGVVFLSIFVIWAIVNIVQIRDNVDSLLGRIDTVAYTLGDIGDRIGDLSEAYEKKNKVFSSQKIEYISYDDATGLCTAKWTVVPNSAPTDAEVVGTAMGKEIQFVRNGAAYEAEFNFKPSEIKEFEICHVSLIVNGVASSEEYTVSKETLVSSLFGFTKVYLGVSISGVKNRVYTINANIEFANHSSVSVTESYLAIVKNGEEIKRKELTENITHLDTDYSETFDAVPSDSVSVASVIKNSNGYTFVFCSIPQQLPSNSDFAVEFASSTIEAVISPSGKIIYVHDYYALSVDLTNYIQSLR